VQVAADGKRLGDFGRGFIENPASSSTFPKCALKVRNGTMFPIISAAVSRTIEDKNALMNRTLNETVEFCGIAYDRSMRMEEAKNRFAIGAMSHMASIAFDKHVSFCGEYTEAVNCALQTLFRSGPHESVLEDANKLSGALAKWNVWLTSEIEAELVKFESASRI